MSVNIGLHVKSKKHWANNQTFPGNAKEEATYYAKRQYAGTYNDNEEMNRACERAMSEAVPKPQPDMARSKPRQAPRPTAKTVAKAGSGAGTLASIG